MKRVTAILMLLVLILTSCTQEQPLPYSHAELVLPLDESFVDTEDENYDIAYTDGEITVAALRISFEAANLTGITDKLSEEHFARYWLNETGHPMQTGEHEGIVCSDYTVNDIYHMVAFYRSRYAYFVVLFAASNDIYMPARERFFEIMRGIWFSYD